jgi:acetyltransferase-like isoleucine patch superfamily enzyme
MNKIVLGKNKFTANAFKQYWVRFWMRYAGLSNIGRIATRFASWFAPPHKASGSLAMMSPKGFISPSATIYHPDLNLGANVLISDRVLIFCDINGGPVEIGDRVCIFRDTIIDIGEGGSVKIGEDTSIHPRCQLNSYLAPIIIGKGVLIAANCLFYPHNHSFALGKPIYQQPTHSKGPIIIGDYSWLGAGAIVLGGVKIGSGAVIGAGAVVTKNIPDNAIAVGVPAQVFKIRN